LSFCNESKSKKPKTKNISSYKLFLAGHFGKCPLKTKHEILGDSLVALIRYEIAVDDAVESLVLIQ
jgi:hypothetical protein